jgi:hypothetical protein
MTVSADREQEATALSGWPPVLPQIGPLDRRHWWRCEAARLFVELVVERYGGPVLRPQGVDWTTVRDSDLGLALGMYGEALSGALADALNGAIGPESAVT